MSEKPVPAKRTRIDPALWSCLMLALGFLLMFVYLQPKVVEFIETNQIPVVEFSITPILIYFFAAVIVLGVVLFLIPTRYLKYLLRGLFAVIYAWGVVITLGLVLPGWPSIAIGAAMAAVWLIFPLIWLQNCLLLLTLTGAGGVFGNLVSPWTITWVLVVISVYDVAAVRFGYMIWMARKFSESDTLPAFVIPHQMRSWNLNLRGSSVKKIFDSDSSEKEFSLLGGGDLGFPLIFTASVYADFGVQGGLVMAVASMAGLIFAYALQIWVLKGKPLPALPPISFFAIIGFLAVRYLI